MKIRNIIPLFIAVVVTTFATACNDFLDRMPVAQRSPESIFTSEESANAAVSGMYRSMMNSFSYGQAILMIPEFSANHLGHVSSFPEFENFATHGIIDPDGGAQQPLPPSNIWLANMWQVTYQTINAANGIIAMVPQMDASVINDARKNQFEGEARFIRAMHYFFLARAFGNVPLELTPSGEQNDEFAPQANTEELYAQIIEDLTRAVEILPLSAGSGLAEKGRANRWAAKALLAKVHLYHATQFTNDFTEAVRLSEDVIQNGSYSLVSNYINIWQAENTTESIFELQFDEQATNPWANEIGDNDGNRTFARGNFVANLYDSLDTRKAATVRLGTRAGLTDRWYIAKYPNLVPATQNFPLIRLAEVYLIHAEAKARVDNAVSDASYQSLAAVQTRAGVVAPISTYTSLAAYIVAIQDEKEKELMFEGETWFDFCRTGLALTRYSTLTDEQYFIYPIPAAQFQVDPTLVQNPGYSQN
ncbi:RagB/SusD family nutrient uptake outer membrane protein [Sphingobacterium chungjuense]|uniref:RagB/SusD family nutrient uptake outer membrane protein n=1 Tax=Sphingobacterium chungjuense TaxID=2675553 RepID=UPI001F117C7C|nr:RagB/SusD family nutrient uptake outer membrane protein [Sphingobacterium chungjuense]